MTGVTDLLLPHMRGLGMYDAPDPPEVLAQRAGIPRDQVLKLDGNENPYGPSPKVAEALGKFDEYNLYPDPLQRRLRHALSDYLGVGPERIVAGNGADEIIDLLMRMCLGSGEKIIDPDPTFGMYKICARICGAEVVTVPRDESFEIDIEATELAIDSATKAIFLASPNNPTGNIAPEWQVRRLLDTGILVVVDETYHEFCGQTVLPLLEEYSNLVVLRTFSKWAGLAGLRIGLGVMHLDLADPMMRAKPPFNVSLAGEIAALASLEDRDMLLERVARIVSERERMFSLLKGVSGVVPFPSQSNFILCQFPDGKAKEVHGRLSSRGIQWRHFSTPRLKDYVRMSIGQPHQNDTVISALEEIMEELA